MANPSYSSNRNDFVGAGVNSVSSETLDGRLIGFQWGRVTDNKDPEHHGRVMVNLEWLEEEGNEFESGWLTRIAPWAGPTKMNRGRNFAFDGPLPEVGSIVVCGFINGNPADGIYFGQPMYLEDETGAPELGKDKHRDWSLRVALQNGFEFGVDTDGNTYLVVPGNLRVKVQCDTFLSSRGKFSIIAATTRFLALGVLRLLGVTIDKTPYPRPDEKEELDDMMLDTMKGPPGRKDPKIGKINELD